MRVVCAASIDEIDHMLEFLMVRVSVCMLTFVGLTLMQNEVVCADIDGLLPVAITLRGLKKSLFADDNE
jgi:hypothetical protein